MYNNFTKYCLTNGAYIRPLTIPLDNDEYVGLCNPSIFMDGDRTRLILRKVNYALWSSDTEHKFESQYGPLWYIIPDDDHHLRTKNYLCEIKGVELEHKLINTSKFDKEPLWDFVGLEDARLVRWNGKLYGTGVRRDTNTIGQGRMELSELDENGNEISRVRIKAPGDDSSYCEKNWMPILDMPYHYVKWCRPLEIVKVNPITGDCEDVLTKEYPEDLKYYSTNSMDIRGSSQVIPWGEYRIAITHLCELWMNEKNQKSGAGYYEQFIVWDKDWNIVKISEPFKFANVGVEFTNGLAYKDGKFYIPFAIQDNFSFLMIVGEDIVSDFIFDEKYDLGNFGLSGNIYWDFFNNPTDSKCCMNLGMEYFNLGYYAASMVLFERASEYNTFNTQDELYDCIYMCGLSVARMGHGRNDAELMLWSKLVDLDMHRSEGYLMLSKFYFWRWRYVEAYTFAKLAYELNNYKLNLGSDLRLTSFDGDIQYIRSLYQTERYTECIPWLEHILREYSLDYNQYKEVTGIRNEFKNNEKNKYRVL